MADTGKQADAAYNKLAQGAVDPNEHLADRVDMVHSDGSDVAPKDSYKVEDHHKPGSAGAEAAQGALDSGHKNNIQNTSARHDAVAAATADGVKRAQESAQQSAQQGSTPHSSATPAAGQPGLVGQTTGAVGEVGSRVYDTGAAAVGVAGSAVGQTAGIASSATSSLFGAVKGLGTSVAGSADKSRQK